MSWWIIKNRYPVTGEKNVKEFSMDFSVVPMYNSSRASGTLSKGTGIKDIDTEIQMEGSMLSEKELTTKGEDRFMNETHELANMDEDDYIALLIESRTIQEFNTVS